MAELATFAAGEAPGVEARFQALPGVLATHIANAGGETEALEIRFDPTQISYDRLLAVFFDSHDPTEGSRQGRGIGTQYRSAIFYQSPGQKAAADAAKHVLEECGRFRRPIATEIVPATRFHRAADHRQTHLERREG